MVVLQGSGALRICQADELRQAAGGGGIGCSLHHLWSTDVNALFRLQAILVLTFTIHQLLPFFSGRQRDQSVATLPGTRGRGSGFREHSFTHHHVVAERGAAARAVGAARARLVARHRATDRCARGQQRRY